MHYDEIIHYLSGAADAELFARSRLIKERAVGQKVYLRGLVELSNVCAKNCYYCGIRRDNHAVDRYELTEHEVLDSVRLAIDRRYGSVVLQAGERTDARFIDFVAHLLTRIKQLPCGADLGITLSLGEQSEATYRLWRSAGAVRYLLRMESFDENLYQQIHPADHLWARRRECLDLLKKTGYQVGTGVMIGLPGQTLDILARDLMAMSQAEIDMCGMGPYVEHAAAPLVACHSAFAPAQRVELTLRMVALLRLMMPTINIASTTALDAIDRGARMRCLAVGANVVMPNISPTSLRRAYALYENKPTEDMDLRSVDVAYGQQGNSLHYLSRIVSKGASKN
ncbi:MAG: [FeFe] hydrogenase H-cluster radical SAM maturase HydE [Mucinivorans sp.]